MNPAQKISALGLSSGGLDSILATVMLRRQGIEVHWLSYETPFFSADKARRAADRLNLPLIVKNITTPYLEMLRAPACGYGQHMNPCLDCHALMAKIAGEIMQEESRHFVFTGEVLGQRPMSQTKPSLRYVEKHSGIQGYLLRPLSARLLPETIPEKKGWVNRNELGEISGRSRKFQMEMAEQFGIKDYPSPAGGCLLADKAFSDRLADLFQYQKTCTENELLLLRFGRHFRLSSEAKLIVGRTKADNENLLRHQDCPHCSVMKVMSYPGPTGLLLGNPDQGELMLAAGICLGYSKAPNEKTGLVTVTTGKNRQTVQMMGVPAENIQHLLI